MTEIFPQATETTLDLGLWQTRALSLGTGPTTVLCLHGWGDSAESFLRLFARLENPGLQLVALDFPGFGKAGPLDESAPQLPQFLDFAAQALAHYAPRGPLLAVGQSLGGRALLMAAHLATPPALMGLVVIGPAPLKLPGWQQVLVRNRGLAPGVSAISQADDATVVSELVASHRRTCFHAPDSVPEQVFADYAQYISPERARHHIERLRQFGSELGQPLEMTGIGCPVHLIWGAQDRIAPLSGARDYQAALPQAQLTVLESCGHHAHLEQPEPIAEVIVGMIRQDP